MTIQSRTLFLLSIAAAVLFGAAPAHAQTSLPATVPTRRPQPLDLRQFDLSPAAIDASTSPYLLTADPAERIDANAATLYLQAIACLSPRENGEALYSIEDIESDDAYAAAAAEKVPWLDTSMPLMLADAARASRVDWGMPMRARTFDVLLPHLNDSRVIANLLSFKARLATAKGDATTALALMAASSALADRLDDGETFVVNELVAVGIQAQTLERLMRIVQLRSCPNLYWSLRQYPQPFGNLRSAVETELTQLSWTFPNLQRARSDDLTAAEWTSTLADVRVRIVASFRGGYVTANGTPDPRIVRLTDAQRIRVGDNAILPAAREHVARTRRMSPEAVAAIEPSKLVAVYHWDTYCALAGEQACGFALPYPQMLPRVSAVADRIWAACEAQPSNPFLTVLPVLHRYAVTNARLDRTIAALACVEAIRGYMACHDGALPATLEALIDAPAPLNPVDGEPFDYVMNADGTATLSDGGEPVEMPMRYELRVWR